MRSEPVLLLLSIFLSVALLLGDATAEPPQLDAASAEQEPTPDLPSPAAGSRRPVATLTK